MSGDNRCCMLCFGIRDAVEVFTGSSIFAEDAYWNVSATNMRSFLPFAVFIVECFRRRLVVRWWEIRAYAEAYLCAGPLRADPWRDRFESEVVPWTR